MITDYLTYYESLRLMTPAQLSGLWEEESEGQYYEMLEVLPPICMKEGAFMVGECITHSQYGALYDAHVLVDGRYFWRPAPLQSFSPTTYKREIRAKFTNSD